jgi:CspA family cold shock protein
MEVLSIEAAPRVHGTVKWFDAGKGFGFIKPDDGGKDIFVSLRILRQAGLSSLNEGTAIEYELETDRKSGKQSAVNLKVG